MTAGFRAAIGPAVLATALGALLLFGVAGVGRGGSPWQADLDWFRVAGQLWLGGHDPYDPETFTAAMARVGRQVDGAGLPYPPQFMPLAMLLGSLPLPAARWLMVGLGLASLSALAWLAVRLVTDATSAPAARLSTTRWLLPALVFGNPFAAHLLWLGQVTPLAVALLVGGWVAVQRGREVWGGILLGLATFKPQLVFLPLFWLLLERRLKVLVAAAAASTACVAAGTGFAEPLDVVGRWLRTLSTYEIDTANRLGGEFVVGIPSALAALGVPMPPVWALPALGIVVTAGVWVGRRQLDQHDVLAWLGLVQCLAVWVHSNDLLLLVPLAAALWRRMAQRRDLWRVGAAGVAALCFPQRLVRLVGWPLLHQWRTVVVGLSAIALARLTRRTEPAQGADTDR